MLRVNLLKSLSTFFLISVVKQLKLLAAIKIVAKHLSPDTNNNLNPHT